MRQRTISTCAAWLTFVFTAIGCNYQRTTSRIWDYCPTETAPGPALGPSYLKISDPEVCETTVKDSISPNAVDYQSITYMPISLQACIVQALQTSEVVRDLGISIIRRPGTLITTFDPALTYSNPRFGEEAALSEFDTQFSTGVYFQKNDRPFNNRFTGNVDGLFKQDYLTDNIQLSKRAATGTLFTIRNLINYDANNQTSNRFSSYWDTALETEVRQPLLQGAGVLFNRIAGPSTEPGQHGNQLGAVRTGRA
jgi:hypothetical protein